MADLLRVIEVIHGLWSRYELTDERQAAIRAWFQNYQTADVVETVRNWYSDHPDSYPKWTAIRAQLAKRHKPKFDPSAWHVEDEIALRELTTMRTEWARTGRVFKYHGERMTVPWETTTEQWICEHLIHKNPSKHEREEAQKELRKLAGVPEPEAV